MNGSQRDGVALNWEMTTFYETTLAAALVNLSKLQNDVKNAEYDVVNKLFADVAKVDIPLTRWRLKLWLQRARAIG